MKSSLENVCAFAANARRALLTADIPPRRVLAYQLVQKLERPRNDRRTYTRSRLHFSSTAAGQSLQPRPEWNQSKPDGISTELDATRLPITCPGCGALSQETNPELAGFYSSSRKAVKTYLKNLRAHSHTKRFTLPLDEDSNREDTSPSSENRDHIESSYIFPNSSEVAHVPPTPVCDRCHDLVYNARGRPIAHPSLEDIADSIAESPFRRNHVYHVLDAADFPMSLIPNLVSELDLAQPRSQNRRSQHDFSSRSTVSFIITRSDLLGPTKDMVDSMMPYFQSTLRKALGRTARNMRLGNVHLVSAKRGWWTQEIKESIWKRGGGNWMVGKVNVGKSNLFEVLFPKGSGERAPVNAEIQEAELESSANAAPLEETENEAKLLQEYSLLPPPQAEVPFPVLPVISSLPGTTVSPIRVPFGRHRGELIDLPGLDRGALESFVQNHLRRQLVMNHRPNVTQHVIKPGQSLILGGGLIRVTPILDPDDPSTTMLAYPFVPLDIHVTSTQKAEDIQNQQRESGIGSILAETTGTHILSAGKYDLTHDITKAKAGPIIAAGISPDRLPFRIYSTDILIEGVGWIELVCQIRRRRTKSSEVAQTPNPGISIEAIDISIPDTNLLKTRSDSIFSQEASLTHPAQTHDPLPGVEIFSPLGKYIGQREPLGAWMKWTEGRAVREKNRSRMSQRGKNRRSKQ